MPERPTDMNQKMTDTIRKVLPSSYRMCKACGRRLTEDAWKSSHNVCPYCGRYYPMPANERFDLIFDPGPTI